MDIEQKRLVIDATMENLDTVLGFVEEELALNDCPVKMSMQICVSLEEIYVNIVNYAYADSIGKCEILLKIENLGAERKMTLIVKDNGIAFNPLNKEDPDITLSAEERNIGGLGIFMVKNYMDEVTYENISGYNILTMIKKW